MMMNPMGIFTVSLFFNRNKEKDRKPKKTNQTKRKALFIIKKGTGKYRAWKLYDVTCSIA